MSLLLDTCIISELVKSSPHPRVLDWFESCDEEMIHISCLTLGELRYGIDVLPGGRKKNDLGMWYHAFIETYKDATLPVSAAIALRWGQERARFKKKGLQIPVIDGLIACTALEYNYTLVTRNVPDFDMMDIQILNPWE